jgi:hypothetical protein
LGLLIRLGLVRCFLFRALFFSVQQATNHQVNGLNALFLAPKQVKKLLKFFIRRGITLRALSAWVPIFQ